VPIIAATLISALSYLPLRLPLRGFSLGVDAFALALTLGYYFTINVRFAVDSALRSWACW
jgi:hypothetical protein